MLSAGLEQATPDSGSENDASSHSAGNEGTMVTGPTKRVAEREYDGALAFDLDTVLARQVSLALSTDIPILMLSHDWRLEGTNPGRQLHAQTRSELTDSHRDGSR